MPEVLTGGFPAEAMLEVRTEGAVRITGGLKWADREFSLEEILASEAYETDEPDYVLFELVVDSETLEPLELPVELFIPETVETGTYSFVYVVDNGTCPADSSTVTIQLIDCLNLDEFSLINKVYPNPVNDQLTIELIDNKNDIQFELMSIQGQQVKLTSIENNDNITMDFSEVPPGMYMLRMISGSVIDEIKIVKQ